MNLSGISFHGTGTIDADGMATLADMAEAHWPSELARLHEMSLVSGQEVIYDLTMFGEEWSPAYMHGQDDPVAWVNAATGERCPGKVRPAN
jgi:hypothetical protein